MSLGTKKGRSEERPKSREETPKEGSDKATPIAISRRKNIRCIAQWQVDSAGCRWHAVCPGLVAHDLSGLCRRDRMLPEVRMARIIDAIGLHQARKLSCVEAAELLGMSERHFRRLRDAYEAHGAEGIVDRRRGRASGRRAPVDEVAWVVEEFRT